MFVGEFNMRVSVIGLGKLGAPLAAVMAAKGIKTIGVDVNPLFVEKINAGQAPIAEPRLQELIDDAPDTLSATTDIKRAIADTDVTFVIVPTPNRPDGRFSLEFINDTTKEIGAALKEKTDFHVVVITSTVLPGDTGGVIVVDLEAKSGKKCGVDFGVCYSPEFIALGNVINDMLHPDFQLIGESDKRSGDILASLYERVCENSPPVARMNFVNAELAKIAVNTYVTTRISYANMLAQICDKLPGADVDTVTSAMGLDSRIGFKYLKGALGYGGPCFPRDNIAFGELARGLGVSALIAEATDAINNKQMENVANTVIEHLPEGGTVGILGLAYKPNTPVIEASASTNLLQRMVYRGIVVVAHDPLAMPGAKAIFQNQVVFAETAAECAGQADVLVIATPWDEYASLTPDDLKTDTRPVVIDCWRILPREVFVGACNYILLGWCAEETEDANATLVASMA